MCEKIEIEGIKWSYVDSMTVRISETSEVVVPSKINDCIVTEIGDEAFCDCSSLESITIPDSVTKIGFRAFKGCSNLTSITILEGVTKIGGGAFEDCSNLTSITIPKSVTEIGESAFDGCSNLSIAVKKKIQELQNK